MYKLKYSKICSKLHSNAFVNKLGPLKYRNVAPDEAYFKSYLPFFGPLFPLQDISVL